MSTQDIEWDIEKGKKNPKLLFQGKPVNDKDFNNFNFLKKDFASTISEQESSQFLHRRLKLLLYILKNNLSNSFYEPESGVGRPKKQFGDWRSGQWLWFVRKDTFHETVKDSIQFQVSINTKEEGDLTIGIWVTGEAKNTRLTALRKSQNKTQFMDLIKNIPNSYYVGIKKTDKNYFEKEISKIDDQFIENFITELSIPKTEFYIRRYVSEKDAIAYETKITNEISNTFETLVPISDFLSSNMELFISPLLQFLKENMKMQANYQPIIIKTLLEAGNVSHFSVSLDEIKEKMKSLNFDRSFNMNDAIDAVSGALSKYVTFGDIVSLHLDSVSSSDIPECLKICGQAIAKWHVEKITTNEFNVWRVLPGSTESNYVFEDDFFKSNIIGVDYDVFRDFSNLSIEQVKEEMIKDGKEGVIGTITSITHKMNPKDIVVLTRGNKEIIDFGIITGNYFFRDKGIEKKKTWLQIGAEILLEQNSTSFYYKEFPKFIDEINKNNIKTPEETIARDIREDIQKHHSDSIFKFLGDGKYCLDTPTTFEKAAEMILFAKNKPMTIDEITNIILEKNMVQTDGKTPDKTLSTIFLRETKNKNSKFIKTNSQTYTLRRIFSDRELIEKKRVKHARNVYWLKQGPIGRSELPELEKSGLISGPQTIFELKNERKKILVDILLGNGQRNAMSQSEAKKKNYQKFFDLLNKKKQFFFYGPPGTGKTFTAKKIAQEFIKESQTKFFSDEQYNEYVLSVINKVSREKGFEFKKQTDNQIILKNSQKEIRIYLNYSKSGKQTPHDCYVGISQSVIDFFNQTVEENRFVLIINNDVKNFVSIPHKFIIKNVKLSGGENWDSNGNSDHSFHIHVYDDKSQFRTNDDYSESYTDCSYFLSNIEILYDDHGKSCNKLEKVTFHQSFSYEEFIEGIRPKTDNKINQVTYPIEDGIFKRLSKCASLHDKENFVLIIDEINRGNISKIFGELITLLENDKRGDKVALPYSKELFSVPENLYIIGTMNTADRSLVHIDAALKRRFGQYELMPDYSILDTKIDKIHLGTLLKNINKKIINAGFRDNQIGHSYFMTGKNPITTKEELQFAFAYDIIPLLKDNFYDDDKILKEILGDGFIDENRNTIAEWMEDVSVFMKTIEGAHPEAIK